MNKSMRTAIADAAAAMKADIKAAYSRGYADAQIKQAEKAAVADPNEAAYEANRQRGEDIRLYGSEAAARNHRRASKAAVAPISAAEKFASIPDGPKHHDERVKALLHR